MASQQKEAQAAPVRRCSVPGCNTILNTYNKGEQCSKKHAPEASRHYDHQKVLFAAVTLYGKPQEGLFKFSTDPEAGRQRKAVVYVLSAYCKMADLHISQRTGLSRTEVHEIVVSGQRNIANIAQDVRTILKMALS